MNDHLKENHLTVIIPAYNEESGIVETLTRLKNACDNSWQILVINDGSTDNTLNLVSGIQGIQVVTHFSNRGYGAAIKTGIKKANTEWIAFYDADGQHNPEDLTNLWNNRGQFDMLIGQRGSDSHQEWVRKPGKWILKKVANFLTGKNIPDLNSGLRLIRTDVIEKLIHLFPDGFSLSTTSTIAFMNMGYNVAYHPIKTNKRIGKSTVKQLKHGSTTILLILRLIVLFNPLKVFLPISFVIMFLGIVYEIYFGIIVLPDAKLIPLAFFMLMTGILIFFFGLVVDQVSEMRKHMYIK